MTYWQGMGPDELIAAHCDQMRRDLAQARGFEHFYKQQADKIEARLSAATAGRAALRQKGET